MFLTLPKNFATTGDVPLFDGKRAIMKLTPIKCGVMLYELKKNSLIGQIFFSDGIATVSIAESKSFLVKSVGNVCTVEPDEGQELNYSYEIFGNCKKYEYKVYEYTKGKNMPIVSAQVTANPLSDDDFCVFLNDESNVVRNLLIVAAAAGL